jgi:hypothetical protein
MDNKKIDQYINNLQTDSNLNPKIKKEILKLIGDEK